MLTNPEAGVSENLDADAISARMMELEGAAVDEPEDDEQPVEAAEQESAEPEPVEDDFEEIEWQDGKKYKIPKAVKPGLMLQSDYTKKTQALAEQRKAIEQHNQAVQQERQYYANQLNGFIQQLGQTIQQGPTEEQLIELSKRDPIAYIQARAERDKQLALYAQAQQNQQMIQQQQMADQQRQMAEFVQTERATLMDKVPEWKDEAVLKREWEEMGKYATSVGYTPEELSQVVNHRDYLVLRDAMRYRQLMAGQQSNAKQVPVQPPKALKPGAAQQPTNSKIPTDLYKSVKAKPTIEGMAEIFKRM